MNSISELKKKILSWTDYYGQDIVYTEEIKKAKSKKQLKKIIEKHITFLEMQHIDAMTHADNFKKECFGD